MTRLAAIGIFATVFLMTANLQIYIHSLRIGLYSWHIFLPVIPIQILIALALGTWMRIDRASILFIGWWMTLLVIMGASILFVDSGARAISEVSRQFTVALMSITFMIVVQRPALVKSAMYAICCAIILAAGVSVLEFINPDINVITDRVFEQVAIEGKVQRPGGLHVNPNANARVMALGMFVSVFFLPQRFRFIFCLITGVGIFVTVSRAGISAWAIAMVFVGILGQFGNGKHAVKIFGLVFIVGMASALATGQIPIFLEKTGIDQYMTVDMTERLSGNFFSQDDDSTGARTRLAQLAIEKYSEHALFGSGIGSAMNLGDMQLGPHNTLLKIAVELGTLGALSFIAIIAIPFYLRSTKAAAFVFLHFYLSMFSDSSLSLPTLAYILPAGTVLLGLLDQKKRYASRKRRSRRKRKRRVPSANPSFT